MRRFQTCGLRLSEVALTCTRTTSTLYVDRTIRSWVLLLTKWEQLWTNEMSRDFIAAEYPWFLETFDGYQFPIQRADSIRYFVLAHYGGTYIDLDDVCILLDNGPRGE